jgi:CubicO group peptidase (beta-lactamase class C family)
MSLLLACLAATSAGAAELAQSKKIDAIFAEFKHAGSPGVGVAVISHGKIVYSKGFGLAQLEYQIPIDRGTIFPAASVSKQFTGMAITLLADRGKLALDDEVQQYLPWVARFEHPITIRQLLHHTSGVRDEWELLTLAGWRKDDPITQEDVRRMMSHQRELNFEPGARFMYSNTGYTLLAEIVARVSGMSFAQFTAENIFKPLGMVHSHFQDDIEMLVPKRAYGYAPKAGGGYRKDERSFGTVGANNLFTTPEDLTLWLDNFRHARVGGAAVIQAMQQPGLLNNGEVLAYAHGISAGKLGTMTVLAHDGRDAAFRSYVVWYAEPEMGIAVQTNLAVSPSDLAGKVAALLLSDQLPAQARAAAAALGPARPFVEPQSQLLDDYVGVYTVSNGYVLQISKDLEHGTLIARAAGTTDELLAYSNDEFLFPAFGATIHFVHDERGTVGRITVNIGGEQLTGQRLASEQGGLDPGQLAQYAGTYYSEELGTFYSIAVVDGQLVASHRRRGDTRLAATAKDQFVSDLLPTIQFERDGHDAVRSMRVSGERVTNLLFVKTSFCPPNCTASAP